MEKKKKEIRFVYAGCPSVRGFGMRISVLLGFEVGEFADSKVSSLVIDYVFNVVIIIIL